MAEHTLKDKLAKGLFWTGFSNVLQQLLNLIFGIFLARILSRADYGLVGMLSIFSLIAGTLQESGFTAALANKREVRNADYNAVFWFSSLTGLFLYLILFFCAPLIARFYDTPILIPLARYSFLGFFISSLGTAQSAYLFRNLMVKQRAIATLLSLTLSGTVGVLMALNGMAFWGIVTQNIVYITTLIGLFWYYSPWRPTFHFDFRPLKGMIGFSSRLLVANIFSHINNGILTVILGKYYSEQEVGDYSQASKWSSMGSSVVIGMINGVAQPVLASVADDRVRQKRVFRKMLRFTAFVAFPALFGLSFIAPELITITITAKWNASIQILQFLCIGSAFTSVCILYSNLIISKGKSNIYMWNTVAQGLFQVAVMLYCYPYGIPFMIHVYVAINIGWLLVWQYFVWREIRLTLFEALKDILPFALIAAATMVITAFLTSAIANLYVRFLVKILVAVSIYTFIMWISQAVTFKESLHYLFKKK